MSAASPQTNVLLETNKHVSGTRALSEEFLQICEQYNFVGYSFDRIDKKRENGQWKKDPIGQPNWTKVNKGNFKRFVRPSHTGFAIITGESDKYSGLTVIDCDTPEAYDQLVTDFPELRATLTAKTLKGMHVYCQFVPTAKNNTHSFQSYANVDIRTKGGIVFAQPTVYEWLDGPVAYKYINLGAAILPMPQRLIDDLKDHSKVSAKPKPSKHLPSNNKAPDNTCKTEPNPQLANEIRELENQLPIDVRDSRISWIQLGAIIHHELGDTTEAKELFLELSRRSPKHNGSVPGRSPASMADMDTVWKDFGKQKGRPATIASLIYAVQEQTRLKGFGFLPDIDDEQAVAPAAQSEPIAAIAELKQTLLVQPPTNASTTTRAVSFNFDKNINQTTLAKFFDQRYGSDFVQTFKLDGSGLSLFHWNAATSLWEPTVKAKLYVMRLLGEEFFDDLHVQAKRLKGGHRSTVYKTLPKLLQSHSSKESIYQEILTYLPLREDVVFDTSRSQYDNLHFRNGVLMLDKVSVNEKGVVSCETAFRPRVKEDYITETLDWDFGPAPELALSRVKEMFRQIQPEPAQSQFQLDWLAYCLTGHTDAHRFKMNIGYTAENGKSTEAKVQRKVFALYSTKLPKNLFAVNNEKRHKFLIELLEKPIRFAYLEELDRTKLDEDLLKDWVDGEEQTVEVLYGTKLKRLSQAKVTTSSNKDPNANADKGLLRRGMVAHYTSKFVSDPGEHPAPNVFKKTGEVDVLFLQEDFRRAYLWMLLPHVVRYYQEGLVVPQFAVQQFKDVVDQYDAFQTALYEMCEEGTEEDRVCKDDLVEALKTKMGGATKWERHVLPELKRLGLKYERGLHAKERFGIGTKRGVILGLKWLSVRGTL